MLFVSLTVGACFLISPPLPPEHSFRIEPDEAMMEISTSDFSWIVMTTLEAGKFDCGTQDEPGRIGDEIESRRCVNLHDDLVVEYRLEQNAVEGTLRSTNYRSMRLGSLRRFENHARILDASFDAAGFVVAYSETTQHRIF